MDLVLNLIIQQIKSGSFTMKGQTLIVIAIMILASGTYAGGKSRSQTGASSRALPPLRFTEPADSIIVDLKTYIPEYMELMEIPGCAIALIYNHNIVWTDGFGSKNSITGSPVDSETLFEVASNSKIVTAYVSLVLADRGRLSMDMPLNSYLSEPWLTNSEYRDSITMRHVLSHSSGLGHNGAGKDVLFPPGSGFYYSNLGFTYLQAVIENITGNSLEKVAGEYVFNPLGMSSTSFINRSDLRHRLANGHVSGSYLARLSGILFLVSLVVVWLPGIFLHRIFRGNWKPKRKTLRGALLVSVLTWVLIAFILFGIVGWIKYAWLITLFGIIFVSSFALLFFAGKACFHLFVFMHSRVRKILIVVWAAVLVSGLILMTVNLNNIPVPKRSSIRPMGAASLRTTVHDMATLMLELSDPQYLHDSIATQLLKPRIELHPEISWGLGTGILHSSQGDALWQWGQNVDFLSVTIIYPEHGFGVVVLTNCDWSKPDVAIEIAHRALGGSMEPILRASHLEFNIQLAD